MVQYVLKNLYFCSSVELAGDEFDVMRACSAFEIPLLQSNVKSFSKNDLISRCVELNLRRDEVQLIDRELLDMLVCWLEKQHLDDSDVDHCELVDREVAEINENGYSSTPLSESDCGGDDRVIAQLFNSSHTITIPDSDDKVTMTPSLSAIKFRGTSNVALDIIRQNGLQLGFNGIQVEDILEALVVDGQLPPVSQILQRFVIEQSKSMFNEDDIVSQQDHKSFISGAVEKAEESDLAILQMESDGSSDVEITMEERLKPSEKPSALPRHSRIAANLVQDDSGPEVAKRSPMDGCDNIDVASGCITSRKVNSKAPAYGAHHQADAIVSGCDFCNTIARILSMEIFYNTPCKSMAEMICHQRLSCQFADSSLVTDSVAGQYERMQE